MKKILLVLCLLLACVGCRKTDVRTFVINIPGVKAQDLPRITKKFVGEPIYNDQNEFVGFNGGYAGVRDFNPKAPEYPRGNPNVIFQLDETKGCLTLHYDSMQIAQKNIEMALAELGFTANGVTPHSIGVAAQ